MLRSPHILGSSYSFTATTPVRSGGNKEKSVAPAGPLRGAKGAATNPSVDAAAPGAADTARLKSSHQRTAAQRTPHARRRRKPRAGGTESMPQKSGASTPLVKDVTAAARPLPARLATA